MIKFIVIMTFISIAVAIHYLTSYAHWRYKRPRSPSRRRSQFGRIRPHWLPKDRVDVADGPSEDVFVSVGLPGQGHRRDLFRVGFDVWGVPGETDASQALADRLKAVLIVLGA